LNPPSAVRRLGGERDEQVTMTPLQKTVFLNGNISG
jgi:hypothetical protein